MAIISFTLPSGSTLTEDPGGRTMLDLIFVALVLIFFLVAALYVRFCERV